MDNDVSIADMMLLLREGTVRLAWTVISRAVRGAGREILKDPAKLAKVLRDAADQLERMGRKPEKVIDGNGGKE